MNKIEADKYFETAHRCLIAGDRVGAVHFLNLGLLENPGHGIAWANRGDLLFQMSEPFEALASYDRALLTLPHEPAIHNARGACLQILRKYDAAEVCYDRSLELDENSVALNNKGLLIQATDPTAAEELHRRAIELDPEHQEYHFHRALALFRLGRLREGWLEYEWRTKMDAHATQGLRITFPQWRGGSAQAVILYAEQGFGDAIHFMRYAPIMQKRFGVPVYLVVRPQLVRLAREISGNISGVIAVGDPVPDRVTHSASLMSMPIVCGTDTIDDVPGAPYLFQSRAVSPHWDKLCISRLPTQGFRVGLCWAGSNNAKLRGAQEHDWRRSMALEDLTPLAEIPGITWVSLQTGPQALEVLNPPPGMVIGSWTEKLDDFYDTATLIQHLDLVITVDTAMVHLAAAMGKPTWLLSNYWNCWRWMGKTPDTSSWYPSLRQFRQPKWGDWGSVVRDVGKALRAELKQTEAA